MELANILLRQEKHQVEPDNLAPVATRRLVEFLVGVEGLQLSIVTAESFLVVKMYADDGAGLEDLPRSTEDLWGNVRGWDQRVVLEQGELQLREDLCGGSEVLRCDCTLQCVVETGNVGHGGCDDGDGGEMEEGVRFDGRGWMELRRVLLLGGMKQWR